MCTNYKLISAVLIALACPLFFLSLNQGDAKVLTEPKGLATYPANMLVFEKSCMLSSLAYNSPGPAGKTALSKLPKELNVVLTAYSSTVEETDSTPFITANGSTVRDGIVANNLLPFGTKIKIPELYGNRIFTVEDRMNAKKSKYHFDIWFPSHDSATDFGVKNTYIEIIES
jgi:3D (Asp-Asp-Asp) domain-containing protein